MSEPKRTKGRLVGWREIAAYLGVTERRALQLRADDPGLASVIQSDPGGRVSARVSDLKPWRRER